MRNRHFLLFDLLALPVAAYIAFVLRLDRLDLGDYWAEWGAFASLAVLIGIPLFHLRGMYRRYWKYASTEELILILQSVAVMVLVVTVAHLFLFATGLVAMGQVPRSIPLIFLLLAATVTAGPRLVARVNEATRLSRRSDRSERALIVGAGEAGVMVSRELTRNPQLGLRATGFLDDDPNKIGARIHDIPVLGSRHDLAQVVRSHGIDHVLIAMPTVPGRIVREIVASCEEYGIKPQILPGVYQLLDGQVTFEQLRSVEIEDLLRRDPVQTDLDSVGELLRGQRVLITGAGGSIGSELARQVLSFGPSEVMLLGHGENSIFRIYHELLGRLRTSREFAGDDQPQLLPVIADVRLHERIDHILSSFRPKIVFHACAHKHVPLMELNPSEAITNNVIGTRNILRSAMNVDVEQFVFVSTDKAVNPTSIMGASKRAAELLVQDAARRTGRPYMCVRFGNVLGSSGSVVLTMKQQIVSGGPVTVTHPEMTRYFMTIPEAVQLTLQAAQLGRGSEVLMFDMGEPVRIVDLARDLIHLSGLEVGEDIEIVYSGVRPGEKLYEELFLPTEQYTRTSHDKIFLVASQSSLDPEALHMFVDRLQTVATAGKDCQIRLILGQLIPEYQPALSLNQVDESRTSNEAHDPRESSWSGTPAVDMIQMRPASGAPE